MASGKQSCCELQITFKTVFLELQTTLNFNNFPGCWSCKHSKGTEAASTERMLELQAQQGY
jgi:hypothetical protein